MFPKSAWVDIHCQLNTKAPGKRVQPLAGFAWRILVKGWELRLEAKYRDIQRQGAAKLEVFYLNFAKHLSKTCQVHRSPRKIWNQSAESNTLHDFASRHSYGFFHVFSLSQGGQTSGAARSVSLLLREQLFSHAVNLFHSMVELLNAHTRCASRQKRNHRANARECGEVADEQHPSLRHSLKVSQSNFDAEENTEQSNEDDVWNDFWKLPLSDPVENNRTSHNRQHSNDSAQEKCLTGLFIPQQPAVAGCSLVPLLSKRDVCHVFPKNCTAWMFIGPMVTEQQLYWPLKQLSSQEV